MIQKDNNIFITILGIISGMSTIAVVIFLFFSGDKIRVDVVNTYQKFFGEFFDFANAGPRLILLTIILTVTFIIFKTSEPITMILYNSSILTVLFSLNQKIELFRYKEGLLFESSFFNIRRIISAEEKKQWLLEKINSYSPGNELEPSKQWLINNCSNIKYDSFDEMIQKLNVKISQYVLEQSKLEVLKLKQKLSSPSKKSVSDYLENLAGWIFDHPKICFIIVVCAGSYIYLKYYHNTATNLADLSKTVVEKEKIQFQMNDTLKTEILELTNKINNNSTEFKDFMQRELLKLTDKINEITSKTIPNLKDNTANGLDVAKKMIAELQQRVNSLDVLTESSSSNMAVKATEIMSKIEQDKQFILKTVADCKSQLDLFQKVDTVTITQDLKTELLLELIQKVNTEVTKVLSTQQVQEILTVQAEMIAKKLYNPEMLQSVMKPIIVPLLQDLDLTQVAWVQATVLTNRGCMILEQRVEALEIASRGINMFT